MCAYPANRELQNEIAERCRAEQEVQKLGELQRAIVAHAAYSVISTTPEGIITSFNPSAERMLGYSAGEIVGKITPLLFHESAEVAECAKACSEELGEKVEPGFEVLVIKARRNLPSRREWTYVRKDGSRFPVTLVVTTLRDPAGQVVGFLGVAGDISELKRAEAELKKSNAKLIISSRQAGMAEVATNVLHNVGNVLNSVNVASCCLAESLRRSKAANLSKVVGLLREHEKDLGEFFTSDPKGRQVPVYLAQLAEHLAGEQADALKELSQLQENIEHIKDIVTMQQSFAKTSGVAEAVKVTDLVDDALRMNLSGLMRHDIEIIKEFKETPTVRVEKHRVLQILINLVRNGEHACKASDTQERKLTVRTTNGKDRVRIAVCDNGVGILPENLVRIFSYGFTTKKDGHGFGLHSGALAAKELGGSLTVHSDGPGRGATFTLELPCEPQNHSDE